MLEQLLIAVVKLRVQRVLGAKLRGLQVGAHRPLEGLVASSVEERVVGVGPYAQYAARDHRVAHILARPEVQGALLGEATELSC